MSSMAVIWKEKNEVYGRIVDVLVYKSDSGVVTEEEKEKAEALDRFLAIEMRKIKLVLDKAGLIELKGKAGVVKFWYGLGQQLVRLIENRRVEPKDRKYLWRAIYDKAPELFTESTADLPSERIEHFIETATKIGKLPWGVVKPVNWTGWSDFCDIRVIREDERLWNWLVIKTKAKSASAQQDWIRALIREISNTLGKRDTSVYSNDEITAELEKILARVHGKGSGGK